MNHPKGKTAVVRYYFMPARNGRQAEVIVVLNSQSQTVKVPTWEEDLELDPFFTRNITPKELEACKGTELWKVFLTWDELISDHYKVYVPDSDLEALDVYRERINLPEDIAA